MASTSRYRFTSRYTESSTFSGRKIVAFGSRDANQYADDPENTVFVVREGDTLEKIANRFYKGYPDAALLYWVIAEFQREPIFDPTRKLRPGSIITIPSPNRIADMIGGVRTSAHHTG
jgi:nucleoid-associated protein YgaU